MSENLDLHEVVDKYIHKLVALHEVYPYQMVMAAGVAEHSARRHKSFLDAHANSIEETSEGTSYQLNFKTMRRSYRLGRRSDRAKTVLKLLPRNFVVSYISEYDAFLGQLITEILKFKPDIIDSKDKSISLSDLMSLGSINAARDKVFAKEVESILRSSHAEQFSWMENKFGLTLTKGLDSWPLFIELTERRNLFVHCDGIVSEQYLNVCNKHKANIGKDIKLGSILDADKKYIKQSYEVLFEIGVKLSQVLWRKLDPNNIENADNSLSHFTYELLIEENYKIAKLLLDFACCTLKKWGSESSRLIYVVNRALCYKFSGDNEKCLSILNTEDWSACGDNYNICVAVLRDDFEKARSIMLRIGSNGSVSESDYAEWPCFKEFRNTEEFISGFKSVFGHSPTTIRKIDSSKNPSSNNLDEKITSENDPIKDLFESIELSQ